MTREPDRSSLIDVALGAPLAPELEAHLAGCEGCRALLEDQRRLLGRIDHELQASLDVRPSPALLPRVRGQVATQAKARWPWRLGWLVPAAALACVLAAVIVRLIRPAPVPEQVAREQTGVVPAPLQGQRSQAKGVGPAEHEQRQPPSQGALVARVPAESRGPAVSVDLPLVADLEPARVTPMSAAPIEVRPIAAANAGAVAPIHVAAIAVPPLTTDSLNEGVNDEHEKE